MEAIKLILNNNVPTMVKMPVAWCCFDDADDYYLNLDADPDWRDQAECYLTNRGWCVIFQYPIIPSNGSSPENIRELHETIATYLNEKSGMTEARIYRPNRDEKAFIRREFARISAISTQS